MPMGYERRGGYGGGANRFGVPNTKPGDHIKIKITRVSNRFASGEVVQ